MSKMIAVPACLPSELLSYTLRYHAISKIIICQTRESFLACLLSSTSPRGEGDLLIRPTETHENTSVSSKDVAIQQNTLSPHPLLLRTIDQISKARHINMVFVPSITHLRAYFSSLAAEADVGSQPLNESSHTLSWIIYGLVDLHRDTSEWSTQGLSGAVATVQEAGHRCGADILLVEELINEETVEATSDGPLVDELPDQDVEKHGLRRELVWQQKMPMLNGSVRRQFNADNIDVEKWMGRTVEVGSVLARWCAFAEKDFWEDHTVS